MFSRVFSSRRLQSFRKNRFLRLQMEQLEDRDVPSTLTISAQLNSPSVELGNPLSITGNVSCDQQMVHLDVAYNWGDGTTTDVDSDDFSAPPTMWMLSHSHTYAATGSYTITVTADAINDGAGIGHASENYSVSVTNLVSPPPSLDPIITSEKIQDSAELGTPGIDRLTRTGGDISQSLTVNYTIDNATADDAAMPDTDYVALTGTATFPAGSSTVDITVVPKKDNLFEDLETIQVTLAPPGEGMSPYTLGTPTTQIITLADDPPQVTATTVWQSLGPEIGVATLTRTGGDLTQPLTAWFEPQATVDIDGEMLTVTLAATAEFGANNSSIAVPIIADAEGGMANVQMPGADPVPPRADQSPVLNNLARNLDDPNGAQFGTTILEGLPDAFKSLTKPITYQEYLALSIIKTKLLALNANAFEDISERTKLLDAIADKVNGPILWQTIPPLQAFGGIVGGAATYAAVITAAPDWTKIELKVSNYLSLLGSEDFQERDEATQSLKSLIGNYLLRGDLSRATAVVWKIQGSLASSNNEVSRRALEIMNFSDVAVRFLPGKVTAVSAVAGAWLFGQ